MPVWYSTADGCMVDIEAPHVNQHNTVLVHLQAALLQVVANHQKIIKCTIDMGMYIGKNVLVATNKYDDVVFAQRSGRRGLTRFVHNRLPSLTRYVTVVIKRLKNPRRDGIISYRLLTAYIGAGSEKEPYDRFATIEEFQQSLAFWSTHAIIWGTQHTISGTEVTECNYPIPTHLLWTQRLSK